MVYIPSITNCSHFVKRGAKVLPIFAAMVKSGEVLRNAGSWQVIASLQVCMQTGFFAERKHRNGLRHTIVPIGNTADNAKTRAVGEYVTSLGGFWCPFTGFPAKNKETGIQGIVDHTIRACRDPTYRLRDLLGYSPPVRPYYHTPGRALASEHAYCW